MIATDAIAALSLFALDPGGAGLIVSGAPCPQRDAALACLRASGLRQRRLPASIELERLTGGVDLGATLAAGRPMESAGLLAQPGADVLVLAMAERWDGVRAALIAGALDRAPRWGVLALDESAAPDEQVAAGLADHCGYRLGLDSLPDDWRPVLADLTAARGLLADVTIGEDMITALCAAAGALGTGSVRGCVLAVRCARGAAALAGRRAVAAEDAALAARLILAPRATRVPAPPPEAESPPELEQAEAAPSVDTAPAADAAGDPDPSRMGALDEIVLEAARVTLPAHLLQGEQSCGRAAATLGRSGDRAAAAARGRPIGSRAGARRDGQRLDVIGTLRAAAPWQRLRGRTDPTQALRLGRDDVRIVRCKPRTASTTIFAVDASGSLALARLADAKGAVELLLAECYVRRDTVALVAFRDRAAQVLLPPTRAPARARRSLAGLAGGGGTPLAAGIDAAGELADAARRRGETPTIVLLTDGQGNIARSGAPGRAAAQADALTAARAIRAHRHRTLLIDTAPRRQPAAQALAEALGGRYVALPRADARAVCDAVRGDRS